MPQIGTRLKGGENQVIGSKELEFKETEHFNFIQSSAQKKGPVRLTCPMAKQGSKKVPSSSLGQIDFFAGQVILKLTCPMYQGQGKSSSDKIIYEN